MFQQIQKYLKIVNGRCPELRVGQIMIAAARSGGWNNDDIFYCPDDVLLKGLEILSGEVAQR